MAHHAITSTGVLSYIFKCHVSSPQRLSIWCGGRSTTLMPVTLVATNFSTGPKRFSCVSARYYPPTSFASVREYSNSVCALSVSLICLRCGSERRWTARWWCGERYLRAARPLGRTPKFVFTNFDHAHSTCFFRVSLLCDSTQQRKLIYSYKFY